MSAFAAGARAARRHPRLAAILWLSLLASALVAWSPIHALFAPFDQGAFRESLLKGWDGWAMISFAFSRRAEIRLATAAVGAAFVVFALLTVFLTGGVVRALIVGRTRPVFRVVVAESAGLFRPNLWATLRLAVAATIWIGLLAVLPHALIAKAVKGTAPPHSFWPAFAFWWTLVAGALVLFNVGLRYDLARVALARGDAVNARGAYRVAKRRLRGNRPSAILLALGWVLVAVAVQALFTDLGLKWNPHTNASTFGLFVFRQFGFFVLAMARVGWWGSLLAWEGVRREPRFS